MLFQYPPSPRPFPPKTRLPCNTCWNELLLLRKWDDTAPCAGGRGHFPWIPVAPRWRMLCLMGLRSSAPWDPRHPEIKLFPSGEALDSWDGRLLFDCHSPSRSGKAGLESWVEISFTAFPSAGAWLVLDSCSANAAVLAQTKSYQLGGLVCLAKGCRIWPLEAHAKSLQLWFWV